MNFKVLYFQEVVNMRIVIIRGMASKLITHYKIEGIRLKVKLLAPNVCLTVEEAAMVALSVPQS